MYIGGTEGFYDNLIANESEELDSFVDEINRGVEVKEEEKMYIGGTEGFYDEPKNGIALGFNSYEEENENNVFEDNLILSNSSFQNYLEHQNNQYLV